MLKFSAVSAEFAGACPSDGPEAHGPEHLEDALEDYPQKKLPIRPIVGLHLHAKSNQEAPAVEVHWASTSVQGITEGLGHDNILGFDVGMHKPTVMVECSAKTSATSTI